MAKVSELTGAQLDYWIAMAEGMVVTDPKELAELAAMGEVGPQVYWIAHNGEIGGTEPLDNRYAGIHSSWMRVGPIIERESISLSGPACAGSNGTWHATSAWRPVSGRVTCPSYGYDDESPLVAAMRAFVASKFGDTVEDFK